ncbi:MAG TPA: CcmD family protein [Desulfohalobiaceae bacterium]|nr:CcmD family protein [Desulfohalobiaceae bacterium]
MKFLWLANCLVWLGICGYLFVLTKHKNRITIRLTQIERLGDERNNRP